MPNLLWQETSVSVVLFKGLKNLVTLNDSKGALMTCCNPYIIKGYTKYECIYNFYMYNQSISRVHELVVEESELALPGAKLWLSSNLVCMQYVQKTMNHYYSESHVGWKSGIRLCYDHGEQKLGRKNSTQWCCENSFWQNKKSSIHSIGKWLVVMSRYTKCAILIPSAYRSMYN